MLTRCRTRSDSLGAGNTQKTGRALDPTAEQPTKTQFRKAKSQSLTQRPLSIALTPPGLVCSVYGPVSDYRCRFPCRVNAEALLRRLAGRGAGSAAASVPPVRNETSGLNDNQRLHHFIPSESGYPSHTSPALENSTLRS